MAARQKLSIHIPKSYFKNKLHTIRVYEPDHRTFLSRIHRGVFLRCEVGMERNTITPVQYAKAQPVATEWL